MPTPSGQISLNDVNVELGLAGTTLITMNDAAVRTLADVGGSGTPISMQNLQNKSNRVTASATISANTANYVLNTAKAPGYSSGKTDMTLTINSGIFVFSDSTGTAALNVDTSWAAGDTVTIVNNGTILGRGGAGGNGVNGGSGNPGSSGGLGLLVQRALTLNNINRISGGGGGGGAGRGGFANPVSSSGSGGGGGIGNGSAGSQGGFTGSPSIAPSNGSAGTLTSAGGGGGGGGGNNIIVGTCVQGENNTSVIAYYGAGGTGGTYGSSGSAGGNMFVGMLSSPCGAFTGSAGSGGGGGGAISGNSNITYINTGTRDGGIS
jgi:hypothetical protein